MTATPARRPLDEQVAVVEDALRRNADFVGILAGAARLDLPSWYLTSGCVFQTVWNGLTGRPAAEGVRDYDLFYFDAADTSWAAEDEVIRRAPEAFGPLAPLVEIRNEARVHLWYEEKFGRPCPPFESTEAAIDRFIATTCSVGVRERPDGSWAIYAPYGLSDMLDMVVRPNPVLAPASVYEAKTARWREQWPGVTVLPWPDERPQAPSAGA